MPRRRAARVPRRFVKFRHIKDGESLELPVGANRLEACCDCGLVHQHEYSRVKKGRLKGAVMDRVTRDERGTAQLRRKMVKAEELNIERDSNAYVLILPIRRRDGFKKPINVRYEYIKG